MTVNEALALILAWVVGLCLGAIFFGGLWWTVRNGLSSRQPAFWFLGSLLLRSGIALAGFYLVASHGFEPLLLCLLGFTVARLVVTQMTRTPGETRPVQKASHAP